MVLAVGGVVWHSDNLLVQLHGHKTGAFHEFASAYLTMLSRRFSVLMYPPDDSMWEHGNSDRNMNTEHDIAAYIQGSDVPNVNNNSLFYR
jgi:hypothetical protein